jgi:hypothetical protein
MSFLKCSRCGYLNPLTGEYQTFCQNCSKKLDNNFSDWHRLHPDKSFEDFKALFAIEEAAPSSGKKGKASRSRFFKKDNNGKTKVRWRPLIAFTIMIAGMVILWNYSSRIFESFLFDKTSKILLTNPWQTITPGSAGLTLSSPFPLNEFNLGLSPQVMDRIEYMKSYKSDEKQPLMIEVNIEKVKPTIKANLQKAAYGAVTEVMSRPDVSDFTYKDSMVRISNLPAILQTGSYLAQNEQNLIFKDLLIAKKRILWQVTILYKADDPYGAEVTDRIIQSVSIQ